MKAGARIAIAAAALVAGASACGAQGTSAYPSRPIRLIVPFSPGGSGSSPHLSGELFRLVAGIDLTHVPFKGSGPGVTALLGGQVTMMFAGPLAFEQHIKSGKLRALAVAFSCSFWRTSREH